MEENKEIKKEENINIETENKQNDKNSLEHLKFLEENHKLFEDFCKKLEELDNKIDTKIKQVSKPDSQKWTKEEPEKKKYKSL